ncbi:MAG: barstar family protein [Anaerolineae bacterium]
MTKLRALLAGDIPPGMYRLALRVPLDQVRDTVEQTGWRYAYINARGVASKPAFLDVFASALRFPDYFGRNWDAFEECLADLSWQSFDGTKGIVIVLDQPDDFARSQPDEWAIACDVLASAVAAHAQTGRPLIVLLRASKTSAAGLSTL